MKNTTIVATVAILLLVGGVWWSNNLETKQLEDSGVNTSDIISKNGVHWHPQISIYANGDKQDIPANIGIGTKYASTPTYDQNMRMTAMHTHETDGTIHLEFSGTVTKENTKLKNFFSIWGKDFMELGSTVTMTVNGEESLELEEYEMKDGDKIELRYE